MKNTLGIGRRARRGGFAFLWAVFFVTMMGALSSPLILMSVSGASEQKQRGSELRAYHMAQAAAGQAVVTIQATGSGKLGSKGTPLNMGSSTYWVEETDIGNDQHSLVATGVNGGMFARVEVVVEETVTAGDPFFVHAAFGDTDFYMDSNALVDSYDSEKGTYESQDTNTYKGYPYAGKAGHVGSNADIDMYSNTMIFGNASPGPGDSVNKSGSPYVSGSTVPALDPVAMPPITVPSYASSGNLSKSSGTKTLASGNYQYGSISLTSSGILKLVGPANIVVNNLTVDGNAQFRIDSTAGPVNIYCTGSLNVLSNAQIRALNYDPKDVSIWVSSSSPKVFFDSNAKVYATVYAPDNEIEINSNAVVYGAIKADRIELNSNARVHFDTSLLSVVSGSTTSTWDRVSWRLVSFGRASEL
jgi:hypothetical protein